MGEGDSAQLLLRRIFEEGKWWPGELWAVNNAGAAFPADRVFCVHDCETTLEILEDSRYDWMRDSPVPIVLGEACPAIKNQQVLPINSILEFFDDTYFSCTPAWAIAYAIYRGVKKIWLYGTDFNYHGLDAVSEARKHCLDYWIAIAKERGVQVIIQAGVTAVNGFDLREHGIYGFKKQPKMDNGKVVAWEARANG